MTSKRRTTRGGGANSYEHRQADVVGKTAKQIMTDRPDTPGKVAARNYMSDAEDTKMSISGSKNREDPMGAYKNGGPVHVPKSSMTMRGKARC